MRKKTTKHNHSHASHHDKRKGLKRWQKNLIHFGLLTLIGVGLMVEGAKVADLGFLVLSVVTEFS